MLYQIAVVYAPGVPDIEKDSRELAETANQNDRQQHLKEVLDKVCSVREDFSASRDFTAEDLYLNHYYVRSIYLAGNLWELPNDLLVLERSGDLRFAGLRVVESRGTETFLRNTTAVPTSDEKVPLALITVQGPDSDPPGDVAGYTRDQVRAMFAMLGASV